MEAAERTVTREPPVSVDTRSSGEAQLGRPGESWDVRECFVFRFLAMPQIEQVTPTVNPL